jgi:hypothetical protein
MHRTCRSPRPSVSLVSGHHPSCTRCPDTWSSYGAPPDELPSHAERIITPIRHPFTAFQGGTRRPPFRPAKQGSSRRE